jgi:hypothetical protein
MAEIVRPPFPQRVAQTLIKYQPPLWLSHAPIWLLPYEPFDGGDAGATDCKYLSVGRAQYDQSRLSAKIFRYVEEAKRWSRMAEEMPLHRVCDLALWIALTLFSKDGDVVVKHGTFHGQDEDFTVGHLANERGAEELQRVLQAFRAGRGQEDSEYEVLKERLTKLKEVLVELGL